MSSPRSGSLLAVVLLHAVAFYALAAGLTRSNSLLTDPKPMFARLLSPETPPEPKHIELPKPLPVSMNLPPPAVPPMVPIEILTPTQREAPAAITVAPAPAAPRETMVVAAAPPTPVEAPPAPVSAPRFDAAYLNNPPPVYPALSRRMRETGKVLLRVHVGIEGTALEVQLRTTSGFPRLDEAAIAAVRQWRFVPAKQGTDTVTAWVVVPVVFQLDA